MLVWAPWEELLVKGLTIFITNCCGPLRWRHRSVCTTPGWREYVVTPVPVDGAPGVSHGGHRDDAGRRRPFNQVDQQGKDIEKQLSDWSPPLRHVDTTALHLLIPVAINNKCKMKNGLPV
ncbi:hypothetical protein EYF80_049615 [Liparis tanakae]|uniref:Uncharacterized protein n=1 Tax=Liparis tanakae TaxID=230148 RepID=A0A4Z2FHG3_9TELE|nr:hypothetical protein EYF80_049615 [Liparis tanakae]